MRVGVSLLVIGLVVGFLVTVGFLEVGFDVAAPLVGLRVGFLVGF